MTNEKRGCTFALLVFGPERRCRYSLICFFRRRPRNEGWHKGEGKKKLSCSRKMPSFSFEHKGWRKSIKPLAGRRPPACRAAPLAPRLTTSRISLSEGFWGNWGRWSALLACIIFGKPVWSRPIIEKWSPETFEGDRCENNSPNQPLLALQLHLRGAWERKTWYVADLCDVFGVNATVTWSALALHYTLCITCQSFLSAGGGNNSETLVLCRIQFKPDFANLFYTARHLWAIEWYGNDKHTACRVFRA